MKYILQILPLEIWSVTKEKAGKNRWSSFYDDWLNFHEKVPAEILTSRRPTNENFINKILCSFLSWIFTFLKVKSEKKNGLTFGCKSQVPVTSFPLVRWKSRDLALKYFNQSENGVSRLTNHMQDQQHNSVHFSNFLQLFGRKTSFLSQNYSSKR